MENIEEFPDRYTAIHYGSSAAHTLLKCNDCSSRANGILIQPHHVEEHEAWHAEQPLP